MPPEAPNPEDLDPGAVLAGDHGDDLQFRAMAQFAVQHVDVVLGRVRFIAGEGVAIQDAGREPLIFQP